MLSKQNYLKLRLMDGFVHLLHLTLSEHEVRRNFKHVNINKNTIAPVITLIINLSFAQFVIPLFFKKSTIVLAPEKTRPA